MQDALFFHRNNNLIIHHHFTMQLVRITALLIFLLTPALAKKKHPVHRGSSQPRQWRTRIPGRLYALGQSAQ